ncbi:hypothetical protein BW21_473 [Burkholderia humptydooensis]|uniref:hypothetical protein n=1 Tax=Burkholderia TaxID=32008 RepID=UPI0005D854B1|nr:hypothetical protein BW21_473 [Burkholderia sp. 2002721687]
MSVERVAGWRVWARWADSCRASGAGWRAAARAALACGVFVCGVYAGRDADWGGVERSRTALEAVASREARARLLLAAPSSRPASRAGAGRSLAERQTPSDFAMRLAGHAGASGLRVRKLERLEGERAGERRDDGAVYAFAFSAEGDFDALCRFLSGLAALPALVVPATSSVKRDDGTTMLDARLDVWPALPGGEPDGRRRADGREVPVADPFSAMPMLAIDDAADAARLVGVMRDRRSGLALFERGSDAWSVAPGQMVDGARIARIRAGGVTLATHGGGRRLMTVGGATG